ncbi:MAG: trypsin-like serine protease [Clostridiales bacterium]|nr:trypsin-like peptidase domain-containing protein [Clostridium sp. N3C]NLZ48151.1 trypsin-like serine protease [Clostridiales bacterium]SCN22522.1 Serine protease Do-like HtrA [Clostridium sp. N3C]
MDFNNNDNLNNNLNNEHKDYIAGENFYMFNPQVEENTENTTEMNSVNSNYSEPKKVKIKMKNGTFRKAMSYVLVGVICATIGAGATLGSALYLLPKTDFFENTPLYEAVSKKSTSTTSSNSVSYNLHPTTVATEEGALTISEIAKKVGPAVVGVSTKSVAGIDWFGNEQISEGIGSGMIINEEGYVLTNQHVIAGATEVKVIFNNGKEVAAKVVNSDANHDIAIVKITEDVEVPGVVELGTSSSLQVGETVVAIGNPLGKEFLGSVTSGIVSAVNRKLGDKDIAYIQTDAAINSGNSGGPLVNSQGQVIGINTAKISSTGTVSVDGMGFAIPIDLVKDKLDDLSKPVPKLGIAGQSIDKTTAKQKGLVEGVFVAEVQDFSGAQMAGIRVGDIIVKFDGQTVKSVDEINKIKSKHAIGDKVEVEVYRYTDDEYKKFQVKLTE